MQKADSNRMINLRLGVLSLICLILSILWLSLIGYLYLSNSELLSKFRLAFWLACNLILLIAAFIFYLKRDLVFTINNPFLLTDIKPLHFDRNLILALLLILSLSFIMEYFLLESLSSSMIDDAFISMRYAKNLSDDGVWGFNKGEWRNTATSPLNVFILALGYMLHNDMEGTACLLNCLYASLLICFIYIFLYQNCKYRLQILLIVFPLVLLSPFYLSTIGLETLLYTLLFVMGLIFMQNRMDIPSGILAGLIILSRGEGILFFLLCIIVLWSNKKRLFRFILATLIITLPWFAYSFIHFKELLPHTLQIKMLQGRWNKIFWFANGMLPYFSKFKYIIPYFSLLILGTFSNLITGRRNLLSMPYSLILAFGILQYAFYSLIIVPPYHWYYATIVICLILLAVSGLESIFKAMDVLKSGRKYINALATTLFVILCLQMALLKNRDGYPPITTNWASADEYKNISTFLKKNYNDSVMIYADEVGSLGFYSGLRFIDSSGIAATKTKGMDKKNEGLPVDEAGIFVMPRNSKSDSILIASGFKGTSLKKGHSPWIGKVEWVVYSR